MHINTPYVNFLALFVCAVFFYSFTMPSLSRSICAKKSMSEESHSDGNDTIRKHPVTFRSEGKNDSLNNMTSSSPFQFWISLCLSLTKEQVIEKSQSMDIKKEADVEVSIQTRPS